MKNLDTPVEELLKSVIQSPFKELESFVPVGSNLKVWDHKVDGYEIDFDGRVRILAIVPKKPAPLDNIHFSMAFCSPLDAKKYRKSISNAIVTGRLLKYLQMTPEERNNGENNGNGVLTSSVRRNCGTIPHLSSLKDLFEQAFMYVGNVPAWVYPEQFMNENVSRRVWMGSEPLEEEVTLEDMAPAEIVEPVIDPANDPVFEGK